MPVRPITKEETVEFIRLQSVAFIAPEWEEERLPHFAVGSYTEDGKLKAGFLMPEYEMYCDGKPLKMVGVGGVASLPEHRHGGAIRECFHYALQRMRESGVVYSALYPFSHTFYRQFGYELCQPLMLYKVSTAALKRFRFRGWARMYAQGEDYKEFVEVYERYAPRYNMAIKRTGAHWDNLMKPNPYKEMAYRYLLGDGERANAYVFFKAERVNSHDHLADVTEIAYEGRAGLYNILGFLSRLAAQYERVQLRLPGDLLIHSLLEESYDIEVGTYDQPMARVLNVERALEAVRAPGDLRYTVAVQDDTLSENAGVYEVCYRDGVASARRIEAASADLSVDIRTLSQLCLGYLSLDMALLKPDAALTGDGEALRRVFTRRESYLSEHF